MTKFEKSQKVGLFFLPRDFLNRKDSDINNFISKVDNFILPRILRWFLICPQILRSISASLSITRSPNHRIWTFCEEFQPSFYAFFPFLGGQKQGETLTGKKCWTNLNICILFTISCPNQRWNSFFLNSFRSPYTRQFPDHGIVDQKWPFFSKKTPCPVIF